MNKKEHLLSCLAEECAEVAHRASKALRFGLDDVAPGQELTNAQQIRQELDDLSVIVQMICNEGMINPWHDVEHMRRKQAKVERYMGYAQERGTLSA